MGCVRVFSESPSAEWVIVGVMMCVWMGRSFTETPTKCSSPSSAVAHSNPTSSSEKEWVGRQWKGVGNSVSVKYHENRCVFELYTGKERGCHHWIRSLFVLALIRCAVIAIPDRKACCWLLGHYRYFYCSYLVFGGSAIFTWWMMKWPKTKLVDVH